MTTKHHTLIEANMFGNAAMPDVINRVWYFGLIKGIH